MTTPIGPSSYIPPQPSSSDERDLRNQIVQLLQGIRSFHSQVQAILDNPELAGNKEIIHKLAEAVSHLGQVSQHT